MSRTKAKPEETYEVNGQLYRDVVLTAGDGSEHTQRRPVADSLEEAKRLRWDYYHPQYGWIIEGYKLAKDRDVADVMADASIGGSPPPEGGSPSSEPQTN